MDVSQTLRQAIAALREEDKDRARQLLAQVLRADPHNESAWLWLMRAVDEPAHAQECAERVLRINPDNEEARQVLEGIRHREAGTTSERRDRTRTTKRASEPKASRVHTESNSVVPRSETQAAAKTSTPRASEPPTEKAKKEGKLGVVGWGCLTIILLAVIGTLFGNQESSTPTPTVSSQEKQAAIHTVQEYEAQEGLKVIDGIGMGLTFVENDGYTIEIDGWYAYKESRRWVVKFDFYVDGGRETAVWWYVPDSGLVIPKNEWAETFMAY